MTNPVTYYFAIGVGQAGCLYDSVQGYSVTTRRELSDILRTELDYHEAPKAKFSEFSVRELWRAMVFAKSASSVSSSVTLRNNNVMEFYGLTEEEYLANWSNDD